MLRFEEKQTFERWVYALLVVAALAAAPLLLAPSAGLRFVFVGNVLLMLLASNLLFMHTTVTEQELVVRFGGWLTLYCCRVPLLEIVSAKADTYDPLGEFGGWGIKGWPGDSVLNARGNKGVRLLLRDGQKLTIGSQKADALESALRR